MSDDGELFFLTVSLKEANVFEWAAATLDPRVDLRERAFIRPPDVSPEQLRREGLAMMDESKRDATCSSFVPTWKRLLASAKRSPQKPAAVRRFTPV